MSAHCGRPRPLPCDLQSCAECRSDLPEEPDGWHEIGGTMYRGPAREHVPCESTTVAHLSVANPNGAVLRCGLLDDHYGPHVFHMEWVAPSQPGSGLLDIAAAIARVRDSRQSHVEWAEHLRTCDHCREHPPEYVQTADEQDEIVAEYDNVLAVLALAARGEALAGKARALADEIEDPRVQRPGMQRRRIWADRLHALLDAVDDADG